MSGGRPRVAVFDFTGCEGCQLQILNLEAELLSLAATVDLVEWREASSDRAERYDIAFVEGSLSRPADEAHLQDIRARASVLVAMGACAVGGGVNQMVNAIGADAATRLVYGPAAPSPRLASAAVRPLRDVVRVDHELPGCPIDGREFVRALKALLLGATPPIPSHPVCVECKRAQNVCRYELGEVCLGPITRAGCGARCPSHGMWCFGCRGPADDMNLPAALAVVRRFGHAPEELERRMALFGLHTPRAGE